MVLKDGHIAIIGSGAWGLSTALHLRRAGYLNITVFDRASQIPSRYSAGWDINKIVRAEYEDKFYSKLSLVSLLPLTAAPRRQEPSNSRVLHRRQSQSGRVRYLPHTITKRDTSLQRLATHLQRLQSIWKRL
jgi:glycine/D-amino acid oxidase-like deaminating enzyme